MTDTPDALLPSAKEVMQQIALAEAEEAEKQARAQAEAEAAKKALIDQLSKPPGTSDEEAIRRGLEIIHTSVLGQVFSVARLQAESTDRGLSRRFAG